MKTVTSVSGGRTSAYLAANYPSDALVFALVRIEDERCRFPDEAIRRQVEDRIQAPFIATAEDDTIIYTMLDLEQYLGRAISWVTGPTYDDVTNNTNKHYGGWLPNKLHRYCTAVMKIEPIFYWWARKFGIENPIEMNIGYRASEYGRANKMLKKLNGDGLKEEKATFEKHPNGNNKWITVPWKKPRFPLIEGAINKDAINAFWLGKPVRFAPYNNCVGCFHRSPPFLKYMFLEHPGKMRWFAEQERPGKGTWRSDVPYKKIEKSLSQIRLHAEDFSDCDSGFCGM